MVIICVQCKSDVSQYVLLRLKLVMVVLASSFFVFSGCTTGEVPTDSEPVDPQITPVDLSGVWSTNSFDTLDNPDWDIVGQFSSRLTTETYEHLQTLLYDSTNDHLSATEIIDALEEHTFAVIDDRLTETGRSVGNAFDLADDPAIQCESFGIFRTVLHSDPIEFEVLDDRIIITGEDLTVDRTVYLDGRDHPEGGVKSPIGHSIGWYEGRTLVVETVNISSNLADDSLAIHNSDGAKGLERYTISSNGRNLDVELTIDDPVMFREPLIIKRPRVLTPNVELDRQPCESISGQF